MFDDNDARMQSESSRRRRNDENIVSSKLIFLIFFVTSCYVLNKIVILSEISIPGSRTTLDSNVTPNDDFIKDESG